MKSSPPDSTQIEILSSASGIEREFGVIDPDQVAKLLGAVASYGH
jgi:hypothetical protein